MLEVKNVKKSFGELQVLKGVSLSVNKGDVVAILGPSGSGKTTLLRCMNFLEMADEGQMTFDGEDFSMHSIPRRDIARLRKKTAFVFQNYNLFRNKTALQNVTEGLIIARRMPKAQAQEIGRHWTRSGCPTGTTTTPASFPADSSKGWPSRGRLPPTRRSSILTSRPPRWTPS